MKGEAIKIDPNKQTNNQDEKKESAVLLGLGRRKTGVGRWHPFSVLSLSRSVSPGDLIRAEAIFIMTYAKNQYIFFVLVMRLSN